jgi:GxxExxY protein
MVRGSANESLVFGDLTNAIIGAFYQTYNELGPGFPEFVARRAFAIALKGAGLDVVEELMLPVRFRGHEIGRFRANLLVADTVIVEVKVSPEIERFHLAQVLHYLKASNREVRPLGELRPHPTVQARDESARRQR